MSALIPQSNQVQSSQEGALQSQGGSAQLPKIGLKEFLNAALRWCWIPMIGLLIGTAVSFVYVARKPTIYTSYGTLDIKTRAPEIFAENPLAESESKDLEQMKTVERGLASSTILLKVAEKNKLSEDEFFRSPDSGPYSPEVIVGILGGRVSVELQKGTRLLQIAVDDTNAERAAQIVEDIVEEYESWKDRDRDALSTRATVGLAKEEKRLKEKMEEADRRLEEFREGNHVLGLGNTQERLQSSKLDILNKKLSDATAERLQMESMVLTMGAADKKSSPVLASRGQRGQLALNLENQIATKESEFAKIQERYLYKHPNYIEASEELRRLNEHLSKVIQEAADALDGDLEAATLREQELEEMVTEARDSAMNDEGIRERFAQLTRQAELARGLYSQVATRYQETQIGATLTTSFLSWNDRPLVPVDPSGPNKKGHLIAGAFLGSVLGVMLALFLSLIDPKVREVTAVERKLRLPILAKLPVYNQQVVNDLSVAGDDVAGLSRPAHLVRYNPAPKDESEKMQSFLFASAFDSDGKTFCVMKCARSMVRQGYRTLVVDGDFSGAGLSRDYNAQYEGRHGLAAYLTGEAEPAEVLFETGLPGLWFLPTGAIETDSGDLLSGPSLRRLFDAISPMFDRVIFDMSSVLESEDVQAVARFVDAIYLVAMKGKGKYRDLKETHEILQSSGGNVIGFIWNEGVGLRRRSSSGLFIEPMIYPAEVREVASNEEVVPSGEDVFMSASTDVVPVERQA